MQMDKFSRAMMTVYCGAATTLAVAALLVFVELRYDTAIYSFLYGPFPLGALLAGMVAASGYYFGARWTNYRPGKLFLANVLAVSGANFFLIYFLDYWFGEQDGQRIHTWLSFPDYLAWELTHTTIASGSSDPSPTHLGSWGYGYAVLLIVGFACGGLIVFALIRALAYCNYCSLYMKKQGAQTRYLLSQADLTRVFQIFKQEAEAGHTRSAVAGHSQSGEREATPATGYSLTVQFASCPQCGHQRLSLAARERTNNRWTAVAKLQYARYADERIDVIEKPA
jgi:hypothetical protein